MHMLKRILVFPAIAGAILVGSVTSNLFMVSLSAVLWFYALSHEITLITVKMNKTNDLARMHKLRSVKAGIFFLFVFFAACMQLFAYWVARLTPEFMNFSFVPRDSNPGLLLVVTFWVSFIFYHFFQEVRKYKRAFRLHSWVF
jgi:hypothetical protein